jgi:hypothetical protein
MIIYSNGCSHTHVHCVEKDKIWSSNIMKNFVSDYYMFISSTNHFNVNLTNQENILINESRCGAGNDYIFHQSLETITHLIDKGKKPNYVLIQWSGPNRRQHCLPNGNLVNVNLFDNVEYHVKFEPMGSKHTLHYMYVLQEFLKKNNIEYYFFNYMPLDQSIKNLSIYQKIDLSKFIDFGHGSEILTKGIIDEIKNKSLSCDEMGHPNEDGNEYISKEILNKIYGK